MLKKDGSEAGPFSKEQVTAMLAEGRVNKTDLAFTEGLSNWLPVLAVITPRSTPPPFKEKNEPTQNTSEPFETSRVKPNETVAQILSQTKSLDWKQVIPYESILQDKPWNLRWVRWLLWFACTFLLINHYVLDGEMAVCLLTANWALAFALGLSFIVKPNRMRSKHLMILIIPALLASVMLFVISGKVRCINSLYQATESDGILARTCAILVTVSINQVFLTSPFAYLYIKRGQTDSARTIIYYGLLAGIAMSMTPELTFILRRKIDAFSGLSLGIFANTSLLVALSLSILMGVWGAITGFLIAMGLRNRQAVYGWMIASLLVPSALAAGYWAFTSAPVQLSIIFVSVCLLSNYLQSTHE